ncbi:transcription antitermination factor NusB [Clostridium sp. MSJ-11]|uniref:Transcription antitermination protein NusB n=1 Tax=Clostridium mobile TaxID=2841512 RepID=A0ABS6ECM5_9CLOT|nr:transcription antitermination factor NusB [Clostridium mobile]MBU5482941.1 transcription antitermination factor NusB [Clostridium mobile]
MNRKKTRELAMKLLFEMIIKKETYLEVIQNLKEANIEEEKDIDLMEEKAEIDPENWDLEDIDIQYLTKVLKGIEENKENLDKKIEANLKNWKISRLAKVDLAILRLSTYEILFEENIPIKVSINEGVELAKKYGEDKSSAFINAVLDNIAKENNKEC